MPLLSSSSAAADFMLRNLGQSLESAKNGITLRVCSLPYFCVVIGVGLVRARCQPAPAPPAKVVTDAHFFGDSTLFGSLLFYCFFVWLGPVSGLLAAALGACCGAWGWFALFPTPLGTSRTHTIQVFWTPGVNQYRTITASMPTTEYAGQ